MCGDRPRVGALHDEILEKVWRESLGDTRTDRPCRRRGATTPHRGGPEGRRWEAGIALRRCVVELHFRLRHVARLLHHPGC